MFGAEQRTGRKQSSLGIHIDQNKFSSSKSIEYSYFFIPDTDTFFHYIFCQHQFIRQKSFKIENDLLQKRILRTLKMTAAELVY